MTPPSIPTKMLAAQVTAYNQPYTLNPSTPVPSPSSLGPYDLLVKVAVASHCHTDTMVRSGVFGTALPCTGSHEGSGTVVHAGVSASSEYNFHIGDRVMCGLPLHPCGKCIDCDVASPETQRQYCKNVAGHVGVHINGCFAEYVLVDARSTTPVPGNVSLLDAAPLACAGRTVWRAVSLAWSCAGLEEGQWLAIVGSGGGSGHLGIQFAKARGLRVIGIDARDGGLEVSRESGADVVIDARRGKEEVVAEVKRVVNEGRNGEFSVDGADATITHADADSAAALGCAVTRMHGTMVQIAQPDEVKIPFQEFVFRDIRIRGSVLCSPGESRDMMRFIEEHPGMISVKTMPFYGLDKIHELVETVEKGQIQGKAIIVVDRAQIESEKELGERA